MTERISDVVVLAPGFLGFDHFGGFPYFGPSVATAIRVALEASRVTAPGALSISTCETNPAGSLAQRQQTFFSQLRAVVSKTQQANEDSQHPPRIHVVGHSTGGLDAELFVSARPLGKPAWTDEENRIRRAIRSIVGIAAPLGGTGLAESPLGRLLASDASAMLRHPFAWWKQHASTDALRELAEIVLSIAEFCPRDATLGQFIAGSLDDLQPVARFVGSVARNRALLDDLQPAMMCEIGARLVPDRELGPLRIARFLTIARQESVPTRTGKLFEMLYRLTSKDRGAGPVERLVSALSDAIDGGRIPVIGSRPPPSPLTLASNDGVVNTARQIPFMAAADGDPFRGVAAIVVADHLDVLGGFPMASALTEGPETADFLNSGSEFRSSEFSRLYRAVANEIAQAIDSDERVPYSADSG